MTNYEKKEDKVLDKIATVQSNLDDTLNKIDDLYADDEKKHTIRKWYEEKKANHEIKKILHEEDKYDNYVEDELSQFEDDYSVWLID